MKKSIIKDTLSLLAITLAAALCLSLVHMLTSPKIAEAEAKEKTDSFYLVSEGAASFEPIDASEVDRFNEGKTGAYVVEAYEAKDGEGNFVGTVVSAVSHNGYGGKHVV